MQCCLRLLKTTLEEQSVCGKNFSEPCRTATEAYGMLKLAFGAELFNILVMFNSGMDTVETRRFPITMELRRKTSSHSKTGDLKRMNRRSATCRERSATKRLRNGAVDNVYYTTNMFILPQQAFVLIKSMTCSPPSIRHRPTLLCFRHSN
jgi:hypothetical protein